MTRSPTASSRTSVAANVAVIMLIWGAVVLGAIAFVSWWAPWETARPAVPVTAPTAQDLRLSAIASAGEALRRATRDPESVIFESVKANAGATVICLQYRAKNGFGGMTREVLVLTPKGTSQEMAAWNTSCRADVSSDEMALYVLNKR